MPQVPYAGALGFTQQVPEHDAVVVAVLVEVVVVVDWHVWKQQLSGPPHSAAPLPHTSPLGHAVNVMPVHVPE